MYFCWKNVSSFCKCKKLLKLFSKNISIYAIFTDQSFNDILTKAIVSFEQLGPDCSDSLTAKYGKKWQFDSAL